jgi:hypothetical protein
MTDVAFNYLLGKIPVADALVFEEVGQCRYSPFLEGYVLTIGEIDYFIASIPKEDNVVPISVIKLAAENNTHEQLETSL